MMEKLNLLLEKNNIIDLKRFLSEQKAADVAFIIENLEAQKQSFVFRIMQKDLAADVFAYLEAETQEKLIKSFSDNELKEILEKLYADDAVDMIEEMPSNVVKRILENSSAEMRKSINELLKYPKNSVGSVMTTEYVSLKQEMTVEEAFSRIRKTGVDKETIYTCYIISPNRKLIGIVSARDLLLADKDKKISEIMFQNIKFASTDMNKEEAAEIIQKYDLLALPVVDLEGRLVGIVTVDDAIDVLSEKATEDIESMAAIVPSDKSYIKTGAVETFLKRTPWLIFLMLSATLTGAVIRKYELALQGEYVILTSFIPMLMGTGGNCGSQASVSVIRSISLNQISIKNIFSVIWKEIRVAILCGVTLAVFNFLKLIFIDRLSVEIALTVNLTLLLVVILAKTIGSALPLVAKSVKLDPAVMASPFITTIVDTLSLLVYFNVAGAILGF